MRHFDLAIIGTGSGNTILSPEFDHLDVALIEQGTFGGTCLNVGCIPTKMYVYAADVAETVRRASQYGIDASVDKVRWPDIRDRIFGRIDPIAAGGRRYRVEDNANVTVFEAESRFTGPKVLQVGEDAIRADQIVIAAGSRPTVPDEVLQSGVPFHTSDDVMRRDTLPEHLVILGGGYIAAEFAHIFSALGVRVSIAARGPTLLRRQDPTICARFTGLARQRWDVHLGRPLHAVDGDGDQVRLTLADGSSLTGDALLVATGRVPNTDRLDASASGIRTHDDGRILVDAYQNAGVNGVYALGDISAPFQLKHVANAEARVVAHNLLHPDEPVAIDHEFVPSAVFTDPPLASVGLTEVQARARGVDFTAKVQDFGDVAYGWAMEDTTGLCKVLAERGTGKLLGAHILGPQASTLIQPLIQAMEFGLGAAQMARGQYWIHPALPEVIENALLGLEL